MAGTVVILTVHGIGRTLRTLDPDEDRTRVTVQQFDQMLDAVVGRTDVPVTFDDGNASDGKIGLLSCSRALLRLLNLDGNPRLGAPRVKFYRSRHVGGVSTPYWLAVLLGESLRTVAGPASVAALLQPSRRTTSIAELG